MASHNKSIDQQPMTNAHPFISTSTAFAADAIARVDGSLRSVGLSWGLQMHRIAPLPIDGVTR